MDVTTKKEKHTSNEQYVTSPTKKPKLDTKLPSLDSEILDSPTDIRRSDSPSSLVNGDIQLDSKNRFMDKLTGWHIEGTHAERANISPSWPSLL